MLENAKLHSIVWLQIQGLGVRNSARSHNFRGDWWSKFYSPHPHAADSGRAIVSCY